MVIRPEAAPARHSDTDANRPPLPTNGATKPRNLDTFPPVASASSAAEASWVWIPGTAAVSNEARPERAA